MKKINDYILESFDEDFSHLEQQKLSEDIKNKNGKFREFVDDKVDKNLGWLAAYDKYFEDCVNDDRMLAEFAHYVSILIGRENFNIEQLKKLVRSLNAIVI